MSGRFAYTILSSPGLIPAVEVVSMGNSTFVVRRFRGWTRSHAYDRASRWLRSTGRWR